MPSEAQHTSPVAHESALVHPTVMPPSGHDAMHVPTPPVMQHDMPIGQPLMRQAGIIGPLSMFIDPLLLPVPPLLLLPPPLLLLLPASFPEFELVDPPQATATTTAPPNHTLTKRLTFFIRE